MTALFITILNMSISASVVALAVMIVRIPLKKAPKIFSYILWVAVLFRLISPLSIDSAFSLMPTSSNAIPQDIVYSQSPAIQTGVQFIDIPINAAISNALPSVSPDSSINPISTVLDIVGYLWLFGFIALLLYATIGYIRLKRRVYYATLVRDNIYETDKISTPFVLGFISPKIYMPLGIEPLQDDYILKHEQTHIKRRDYLIKPFAFIIFALHWFNPLMWASYWLMAKDIEMSCDEAVLKKTDRDIRGVYSSSLLNLSVKRGSLLLTPLAFGESGVKERVKNVLNFKKSTVWITAISILVVASILIGFTSNRNNTETYSNTNTIDLPVVTLEGTNNSINAAFYKDGFDYEYENLPTLTLSDSYGILKIALSDNFGDLVQLGEDYYTYTSNAGFCDKETYLLEKDEDSAVTLAISRRGTVKDEDAIYYLKNDQGTFVFKIVLPLS